MQSNFNLFNGKLKASDNDTLFSKNENSHDLDNNDVLFKTNKTKAGKNDFLFKSDKTKGEYRELLFDSDKVTDDNNNENSSWKVLIVDDEKDIHTVTQIALKRFQFKGKKIRILSAFSVSEAKAVLDKHPDVALILLDIVMETDNAGFDLLKYIRTQLNNKHVRVIIRTGQPGQTPESEVVKKHEANDYKLKTDCTNEQLINSIITGIRTYNDIIELDNSRKKLEQMVQKRSQELINQSEKLSIIKNDIEKQTQAKAAYFSSMSHELRSPMSGILGMAEMLYDTDLSEEQKNLINDICTSGEQLLNVINNILEYSKLESKCVKLEQEVIYIKYCIQDVIMQQKRNAEKKGLQIDFETTSDIPEKLYGDQTRIEQILFHLLDNAVKFTNNGNIKVFMKKNIPETNDENETVELQFFIKDTGIGINQDIKDHIFDNITLQSNSQIKFFNGTGLGLAICRKLIELMNGKIWVESTSDKGTTFSFTIQITKKNNVISSQ